MESTSVDYLVIATGADEAEERQHGPTRPHGARQRVATQSLRAICQFVFRLFSK